MRQIPIALTILVLIFVVTIASVAATAVNRLSICNNEGYAGDVLTIPIMLEGTSGERIGHWRTFYKTVEGDSATANITNWLEVIPEDYTLKAGEEKAFSVRISIPKDAKPGLYGATSEYAGMEGHSGERRTYILFEDASAAAGAGDSTVYTGLMIPVSVNVLAVQNPFTLITRGLKENKHLVALVAIAVILIVVLWRKKR
ncbi:hypothetical protein C5S36_11665 [Candidatus Methanophagaceae archaeon]|nr:hypothetical protein C5S36_11665 [Methanophagales archaeon]